VGGESVSFLVLPDDESGGPFEFAWLLDGAPIGGSSSCLHLFTSPHDPPQRTVGVEVSTRGGTGGIRRLEPVSRTTDDYGDPMEVGRWTEGRLYRLSSGVTYHLNVSAYDVDGNESGFSSPVSFVAP
jgi:hypothetical protein